MRRRVNPDTTFGHGDRTARRPMGRKARALSASIVRCGCSRVALGAYVEGMRRGVLHLLDGVSRHLATNRLRDRLLMNRAVGDPIVDDRVVCHVRGVVDDRYVASGGAMYGRRFGSVM